MSTLKIALQDASHALLEAVEKEQVRDASSTGMNATLPALPELRQQQQQQHCSTNGSHNGKDSEEDPIMAAFLEAQNRSLPSLNFEDWARLIVVSSKIATVPNNGNVP